MNSHKNARLTYLRRLELVQDMSERGLSVSQSAAKQGVSTPTARKWHARYLAGGVDALLDKSSRPARSPRAIDPRVVATIVELRRKLYLQATIASYMGVSKATVGIGLRHHADMVYVEAVRAVDSPPPPIDRGMPVPLLASAMGNAWLAAASYEERLHAANQLKVKYPAAYKSYAHRLTDAVREYLEKGFCSSVGYLSSERFAVAIPLRRRVDGEILVFNCAVRVGGPRQKTLGERLRATVREIERAAGLDDS